MAGDVVALSPGLIDELDDEDQALLAKCCWETNLNREAVRLMLDLGFPIDAPEFNHGYQACTTPHGVVTLNWLDCSFNAGIPSIDVIRTITAPRWDLRFTAASSPGAILKVTSRRSFACCSRPEHRSTTDSIRADTPESTLRFNPAKRAAMNDFKFAFRQLLKSPGFTAVAVITLAVGIGANTAMFSVVNGVMLRALPFKDPDRIVRIWESNRDAERRRVALSNFLDWRQQNSVFESMGLSPAWAGSREFNVVGTDGSDRVAGAYVSSGFFSALGVTPLLGRTFLSEEDQPENSAVAVLSHGLWQRRFGGDANILGKTVTLDSFWRRNSPSWGSCLRPSNFKPGMNCGYPPAG